MQEKEKQVPLNGVNISMTSEVTPEISDLVDDMFEYHAWNDKQKFDGSLVRKVLADAVRQIIACVPPSADRSVAIRKIREARMDCNSAITHGGKY